MASERPLSEGNTLQRAYYRWAVPHYALMEPALREQVELIDRFLYSRRGLLFWGATACAMAGTAYGLVRIDFPPWMAASMSLLLWGALPLSLLSAWLQPALFTHGVLRRRVPQVLAMSLLAGLLGFGTGHVARRGELDIDALMRSLADGAAVLAAAVALAAGAISALIWGVARVRQHVLERELREARLQIERDEARRHAAQARLGLLQLQIQPHFVFNTLAAVQHWVDTADPRAGPMLRSLTAFLRSTTDALGRDSVRLGDEAALAGHYLQVMQARLGSRLSFDIRIDPASAERQLPPGLLLTLVENAIEHGVEPAIAGGDVSITTGIDAQGHPWIEVSDSGGRLSAPAADAGAHPAQPAGRGVGLANCRARLRHAFGDNARLELRVVDSRTAARITLP